MFFPVENLLGWEITHKWAVDAWVSALLAYKVNNTSTHVSPSAIYTCTLYTSVILFFFTADCVSSFQVTLSNSHSSFLKTHSHDCCVFGSLQARHATLVHVHALV